MSTAITGSEVASLSWAGKVRRLARLAWSYKMGYIFMAPVMLHWLIFGLYPYFRGLTIMFQDYRRYDPKTWGWSSFVGFGNFVKMFKDPNVWPGIKASFYMWIAVFPVTFVTSLFAAVILNRIKNPREAAIYRVIITLAWVIPEVAAMRVWRAIYEPNFGYLTHFLRDVLKVWPDPPNWVNDKFWYWPSFAITSVWKGYGYNMLLFLLGLYNIPSELYDAAKIDGANGWQTLLHVELPGIRNLMLLYLVTNVGWVGGGVTNVMLFGMGPGQVGKTLNFYSYEVSFGGGGMMGYGAAISFFTGVCNLLIAAIVFKLFPSQKA